MAIDTKNANRKRAEQVLAALPPWPTAAVPVPRAGEASLSVDPDTGRVKVAGSRIAIDTVVYAHREGQTPGDIVRNYPALLLRDVEAVISYYLRHKQDVDSYLHTWEEYDAAVRNVVEADPVHQAFRATLTEGRGATGE
ncbi:MAG: DUF433 domain-containing protein [Rhodospirillales bacterium]|nr:DUF433 domain-containing protein [Rhodospirillales bacterium]